MATHIFGVDLNELMTRNNEQTVPSFVIKTIRYLNTHGNNLFIPTSQPTTPTHSLTSSSKTTYDSQLTYYVCK